LCAYHCYLPLGDFKSRKKIHNLSIYFRVITKDTLSPDFGQLLRRTFTELRKIPEVERLGAIHKRLKIATQLLAIAITQWNNISKQSNTVVFTELEELGNQIIKILPETGRLLMVHAVCNNQFLL
jgi:hypothetical protein